MEGSSDVVSDLFATDSAPTMASPATDRNDSPKLSRSELKALRPLAQHQDTLMLPSLDEVMAFIRSGQEVASSPNPFSSLALSPTTRFKSTIAACCGTFSESSAFLLCDLCGEGQAGLDELSRVGRSSTIVPMTIIPPHSIPQNHPTMESVLEWLSDSSVHPRNKVNSFQWFHIPTFLTTHIPSQPTKQNNELLSQLLQRMMTILDECFDCHTPIANKRLLHSSLSQLSQSPSLDPKIKRGAGKCLVSLEIVEEGAFVVIPTEDFDKSETTQTTLSNLQKQHDELQAKLSESEGNVARLEKEKKTHLSSIQSLQKEKEQLRSELASKTQKLEENERVIEKQKQIIQQTKTEVSKKETIVASDIIVAFSPLHFRVSGSTVTRINSVGWAGCFTKPVSKGIHRLSIKTEAKYVMIGVFDALEYPKHLTSAVFHSPKAAMMHNDNGCLYSAYKSIALNTITRNGQEWSAEADLEKRTLHFFIDGVQQKHHFTNIPVPLVFAIDVYTRDVPIEITFWGELKKSSVTFQGTGHNLG
ncbi:hypothetical protein BLNAU_16489 [Blattamonas nauphoetae]|uniref:SPRY domain-containing protein n=1 Tax=Blattamonas nauphoetae TaxID=2049346 RepID=A0ABQ9XB82_9EUKA|nr:hypothetical protein BLNAU_16489 [Blattamonas nauphoetae]